MTLGFGLFWVAGGVVTAGAFFLFWRRVGETCPTRGRAALLVALCAAAWPAVFALLLMLWISCVLWEPVAEWLSRPLCGGDEDGGR